MGNVLVFVLFAVGLVCLIKGGDWFVDGASGIAHRFHIPELLIGATVVSIGTTLPEVMVSATAAFENNSGIAYGNAIGSIICNTSLIAALTIAIHPGEIKRKELKTPVIFFFSSALFYVFIAYAFKRFDRWVGIVLLLTFIAYLTINVFEALKARKEEPADEEATIEESPLWKQLLLLIVGAALIALGATLLVDNGTIIAQLLGVPDSVIGLTIVALGTSLPELVTAITSLVKGHSNLSVGNIIGANLFNLVFVSGTAVTILPFDVPNENQIAGINTSYLVEIPLMLACMLIMVVPALIKGKMHRAQGIVLLVLYAAFCVFQFACGLA